MKAARGLVNVYAIRAIAKRDLRRYFTNPTGYTFITLFILLSGISAFWRQEFFLHNLANLDQLNEVFPYLAVAFVAAVTMGVWADERKQGTDEVLLTLPAAYLDIVLGKYIAVLGIYSIAVLLALTHAAVLVHLADPDAGLLIANYVGYWLVGATLIPCGMLASTLTANAAVAFILAAFLCIEPVIVDRTAGLLGDDYGRWMTPYGMFFHFNEFARGVLDARALVFLAGLATTFLWLNVVMIRRRLGSGEHGGFPFAAHVALRTIAAFAALGALTVLVGRAQMRVDVTAERVHSLSAATRRAIEEVPAERVVSIQAFVSPSVPDQYIQLRESLVSTLDEIRATGRGRVQITITETEPYSAAARGARERFGIIPRLITAPGMLTDQPDEIFLGVAVISGTDEQVIPFLEQGLSPEYEIVRAIRVVTRTARRRIGVIDGDANLFGGIDGDSGRSRLPWAIVTELRKQYDVVQVSPDAIMNANLNALVVVLPSRFLQHELDNLHAALEKGIPALLLVDPLPTMDLRLAPAAPMADRMDPFRDSRRALVRKNTGNIQQFMATLGLTWPPTRIAWDGYTPHPELAELPKEVIFARASNGSASGLNTTHPATSRLEEVMVLYAGYLQPLEGSPLTFIPLVRTTSLAGIHSYFDVVRPSPAGPVVNANLVRTAEGRELVLAAEVHRSERATSVNVIVIADLDFISDRAFEMRAEGSDVPTVDNIAFFLNCIDVLSGDESFIALRQQRVRYRTLTRLETQVRAFLKQRTLDEQAATADAEAALEAGRRRVKDAVDATQRRTDLDAQARQIVARNVEAVESRKLEMLRATIEQEKAARIQASRETMEENLRRIQNSVRLTAVVLPTVPVVCLAIVVSVRRRLAEKDAAAAARRLRNDA